MNNKKFLLSVIMFFAAFFLPLLACLPEEDQADSRDKIIEQYINETEKSLSKPVVKEEVKVLASGKNEVQGTKTGPAKSSPAVEQFKKEAQRLQAQSVVQPSYPPIVYRLDSDDILDITVWQHPDLNSEVIVRPDGKISFPLIGDIQAKGLTALELKSRITKRLIAFGKQRASKPKAENKYLIGIGDTLDISVWKIPDLSKEVIVRPDGMVSFPLIGDIESVGKTLTELSKILTEKLKTYVKDPQVSVMVKAFGAKIEAMEDIFLNEKPEVSVVIKKLGGKKVIVMGDVNDPGVFTFTTEIRLAEAISLAGDFTRYAVRNSIVIIRGDIKNKPQVIIADMVKLYKYGDLSQNVLLQPEDVIFVPRTFVGNIADFIYLIAPILDSIYRGQVINSMI